MKILCLALFLSLSSLLHAQYFYNDIIGTAETNRQMQAFVQNKVKMVSATGFDENGVRATDFSEVQEIRENGRAIRYSSRSGTGYTTYYSRFDDKGRLISIHDSSSTAISITNYEYDVAGHITKVSNSIKDTANEIDQQEIHQWVYGNDAKPIRMWRIINNSDSTEVRFTPDEDGNTGDETTYKKGVESGKVYYYYDDRNRLSDIVRYNTRFKKLLPDVMFEYDDKDHVIQKITTTSSLHLSYLIWRYIYNEAGLKTKEALFNDKKELTGKIEYSYTF